MEEETKDHIERAYSLTHNMEEELMMLDAELSRRISNLRKMREECLKEHKRFWDAINSESINKANSEGKK